MNILFLGSSGPLSLIPLRFLLQSEHNVCAIGYETNSVASFSGLKYPVIAGYNESVEMLAHMTGLSGIKLFDDRDDSLRAIKQCKPDIIIVSCLAKKLSDKLLSIPVLGCFNLHPSLLPVFRGPVPLFWQFREGIENFGMSLHRMTSSLDGGPVIARKILTMPDGITNQIASELLAKAGAVLLEQTLDKISGGKVADHAQNESEASYQSYPKASDFMVSTSWRARRLYNFICATRHWNRPYPCQLDHQVYPLIEAVSYGERTEPNARAGVKGKIITLPCVDGVVTARLV